SHFDNVGCPTPHSFDNAFALILDGPIIFATIFSLNFSLCFTASSAFSPPGFFRSAQAATSLTQGGPKLLTKTCARVARSEPSGQLLHDTTCVWDIGQGEDGVRLGD